MKKMKTYFSVGLLVDAGSFNCMNNNKQSERETKKLFPL